ncbi:MAG: S49 family peptidase, partial [Paracoccus sp. (in: a-proteobacteria)]|nr:S49 family peptidase [Paracoccus sp. (in: a-proteobacteria)]
KYRPVFITDCQRSIDGTKKMVKSWLVGNMFAGQTDAEATAQATVDHLTNIKETSEHGHHFLRDKCKEFGLVIEDLESSQDLQEAVLSVHHGYVASFSRLSSIKFIENSNGTSWNVSES